MHKVLVFYWYVPRFYWHPVYDLHLKNLMMYKNVFDSILFVISSDADSKGVDETVESIKTFVPNADFKFVENDKTSRESKFFYDNIVVPMKNYNDKAALFFAHNKGVDSIYVPKEDRNNWINAMYYFNLRNVDRINEEISKAETCAIGTGRMINYAPHEFKSFCTNKWLYTGTFFWIIPSRVYKYAEDHGIKIIENKGRYYTEGFLGTIFPDNANECKCFPGNKYVDENWKEYILRTASKEEIMDFESLYGKL